MKKAKAGLLLITPITLGCALFYIVPFFYVVLSTFTQGFGDSMVFVGLSQYQNLLNNDIFLLAFKNTLLFLAIGLPLIMTISYAIALVIQKKSNKLSITRTVLLLPYTMPAMGTVVLVELLFSMESGLVNQVRTSLSLPLVDLFNSNYSFLIILLLYIWKNAGYSTILLLSGLLSIPEEHYGASALDGANARQQFVYITMPQMWYSIFISAVFSILNAFKCFREIFLIGGEHPDKSIYMLQHFINNNFQNLNYPRLTVASVLLFLTVASFIGILYFWLEHKKQGGTND